jgi:hypothetical protein
MSRTLLGFFVSASVHSRELNLNEVCVQIHDSGTCGIMHAQERDYSYLAVQYSILSSDEGLKQPWHIIFDLYLSPLHISLVEIHKIQFVYYQLFAIRNRVE